MSEPVWPAMSVVVSAWSMSDPHTRASERIVTEVELDELLASLRAEGAGYLEVSRGGDYPVITLGFAEGRAVVTSFTSPEVTALLRGDGLLTPAKTLEVPVFAELASFTGEFASSVENAWRAVRRFVTSGNLADAGEWVPL